MRSRRMEQQGQNEPANMLSEYECITRPVVAKVSQQTSREREREQVGAADVAVQLAAAAGGKNKAPTPLHCIEVWLSSRFAQNSNSCDS